MVGPMISVPLEPTEAMKAAGLRQWIDQKEMDVAAIWTAMCAAAPSPAGGREAQEGVHPVFVQAQKVQWLRFQSDRLSSAAQALVDACLRADVMGDLSEEVDGSLIDDVTSALAALSHPVSGGGGLGALAPLVPTEQAETPVVADLETALDNWIVVGLRDADRRLSSLPMAQTSTPEDAEAGRTAAYQVGYQNGVKATLTDACFVIQHARPAPAVAPSGGA